MNKRPHPKEVLAIEKELYNARKSLSEIFFAKGSQATSVDTRKEFEIRQEVVRLEQKLHAMGALKPLSDRGGKFLIKD